MNFCFKIALLENKLSFIVLCNCLPKRSKKPIPYRTVIENNLPCLRIALLVDRFANNYNVAMEHKAFSNNFGKISNCFWII